MTFLRNCALLLPAGFLVAAFVFLISHGPADPALAVFPTVGEWIGADRLPKSPEVSFLFQSGLLFLLPYLLWLALVLLVSLGERALLGRPAREPGLLHRTFAGTIVFFFLVLCGIAGASTAAVKRKLRVEGPVGVAVVAAAPFVAGAVAPVPAIVAALPLAGFLRMRS